MTLHAQAQHRKRNILLLLGMAVLLLLTGAVSLRVGSYATPTLELIKGIFGRAADQNINAVVRLRLPRICTAMICGMGLGVTGCILQSSLQNPLAASSTLGISQGAGFGAAFAIMVLGAGSGAVGTAAVPAARTGSFAAYRAGQPAVSQPLPPVQNRRPLSVAYRAAPSRRIR